MDITSNDIREIFETFLLMEDTEIIRLMLATMIGNQITSNFPIWIMFVAPPSSGKTTLLNSLTDLHLTNQDGEFIKMVHSISDLTTNSFASGMTRGDKETSLLHQMHFGSVMIFKDFTSILSKHGDDKMNIMAQLREIYDGSYTKRTGNGNDIQWSGKVGAIAGVTQAIYQHLQSMSVMGDRFMLYEMNQPNRKEMLRFKLKQRKKQITEHNTMPDVKEMVKAYLQKAYDNLEDIEILINEETQDEIVEIADFCTMVRSGVVTNDYTGKILFVPEPEMPARVFDQMMGLASAFALMRKIDKTNVKNPGVLSKKDFKLMYKIAFDSIPAVRRIALRYLAKYKNGVGTNALAMKINYPMDVVEDWLEQLNALGVVRRVNKVSGGNYWAIDDTYRDIMVKLQNVEVVDEALIDDSNIHEDDIEREWEINKEMTQKEINADWDDF